MPRVYCTRGITVTGNIPLQHAAADTVRLPDAAKVQDADSI